MTLVSFVVTLVFLGIVAYLVERFVPMGEPFKTIFRIVCVVVAIVLVWNFLSHFAGLPRLG